jgi:hypothetical protein
MVSKENIVAGTLFLTVISWEPRGTYFIALNSSRSPFF